VVKEISNLEVRHKTDQAELIELSYNSIKREAQFRADALKQSMRNEIVEAYKNNWNQYVYDYDNPSETTKLDKISAENLGLPLYKYMYVKSHQDSNDMFILSSNGIRNDLSIDSSAKGYIRTFDNEYAMHFNPELGKQAVSAILSNKKTDIFWQRTNTAGAKTPTITNMNIENLFYVDKLEDIRDIECLVYSTIDDYGDITGVKDVSVLGQKQDNRKLYIVQGFNLYDQIQEQYIIEFKNLDTDYERQLAELQSRKDGIMLKFGFLTITILVTFIALSSLQNMCVRGVGQYGGDVN
jgi:hypothetical protein